MNADISWLFLHMSIGQFWDNKINTQNFHWRGAYNLKWNLRRGGSVSQSFLAVPSPAVQPTTKKREWLTSAMLGLQGASGNESTSSTSSTSSVGTSQRVQDHGRPGVLLIWPELFREAREVDLQEHDVWLRAAGTWQQQEDDCWDFQLWTQVGGRR